MNPTETMQRLIELGACEEARKWAKDKTAQECWEQCHRGDWLLWWAKKEGIGLRELTLAKGKCAETVIHLMKDQRSKDAVQAAIDYGNGLITDDQLRTAYAAAAYATTAADATADADADADAADAAAYAAAAAADAAAYATADADAAYAAADARRKAREENQQMTADIVRFTIKPTWI
jgi:pyruvate/2-oxoglutarate dehydrogenase complex dihydrolipoamide acyltransferase (E2) component